MSRTSRDINKKEPRRKAKDSAHRVDDPKDAELCARMNRGDTEAFSEAYTHYVGRLTRYLWSRIPERDTVEDLVSEVFLKFWQFLKMGGRISHLPAFLFQSTRNILKDFFRRKKQQSTVPFSVIEGTSLERTLVSPKEGLYEHLDQQLAFERFTLLIRHLPERQRQVVLLRYVEGMKTKEIASLTRLSHANTRVLLHRGLRTLRQLAKDEEGLASMFESRAPLAVARRPTPHVL